MVSRGTLEGTIKRYVGKSTDQKPGTLLDDIAVPAGSSFFERDTFRIARYDGTQWYYEPEDPILAELMEMNRLLGLVLERLPVLEPANPFG